MLTNWLPGDPLPWFIARSTSNPRYVFSSTAGRYVVLCLFGSGSHPRVAAALRMMAANRHLFDDAKVVFFGVSVDPEDEWAGRLEPSLPGCRYFCDFDYAVSRLYGALGDAPATEARADPSVAYRPYWLVLDPQLRVLRAFALSEGEAVMLFVADLPPVALHAGGEVPAPVLVLPRIFEPEFCRRLIELYERRGGKESGFMREIDGKTVGVLDPAFKRRAD